MRGFRLSPQQRRLWQLGAEAAACRAQFALVLAGAAGGETPRRALELLVARHEILRTTFHGDAPGLPVQVVEAAGDFQWREAGPLDERGFEDLLASERRDAFDLAAGPVLHACLASLADGRQLLVLTLPALCADTSSLHNLAGEVATLCGGGMLAADPVQYAKYAEWQNSLLEEEEAGQGRDFWLGLGLAALPPLVLPLAAASAPGEAHVRRSVPVDLTAIPAARLDEWARTVGVSVAELLLAVWQGLLFRMTGQVDLAVGVACDGREYEILAGAVGPISRYLPVRANLDPALGLGELAHTAGGRLAEAREWQEYFEDESGEALFSFDEPAAGVQELLADDVCCEPFLVRLAAARRAGGIAVELAYDPARLDADAASRLAGSFSRLLAGALDRPGAALGELEAVGESELREVVVDWNRTARRFAGPECVHELFAQWARRCPEGVAVVCDGREMTYGELHARSNQLAHRLRRLGIGPGARVALLLDRSLEMLTAIWGVLKAGAAYAPVDPTLPAERVGLLLAGARAAMVLTKGALASGLPVASSPSLRLDEVAGDLDREPTDDLPPLAAGGDLAYVLFTSGSTGVPKGVEVEHRQLANYVRGISELIDLPPGSGFAMVSTFAADLGNTVLFPALCGGGRLFVATEERASDPELLAADFDRFGVDCMKIVPSHLSALLNAFRPERLVPRALLILGGEALSWELAERVAALAPGCRILNHYGPTETTVGILAFPVEHGRRCPFAAGVPLGQPLPNTRVYLLDAALRLVPTGMPGELHAGGASLARGYQDAAGLTAERFIPNPFGSDAGARLYRTGDRARMLPGGQVEFLGRVDRQVKVRGFRVEPGEVEAALRSHPAVRDAVVMPGAEAAAVGALIAYVVAEEGAATGERPFRLPNGLEVFHLNKNETLHLYRQIFEDRIYLRHGIELEDGICVFDVGANIGLFSLFVHRMCRNPRIYAFEPSPASFETLRRNVDLHSLDARLHQAGVAAGRGTATFTVYPRVSVMSGFHADPREEELLFRGYLANQQLAGVPGAKLLSGEADELVADRFARQEIVCELTSISDAIREHGVERIDLLKIDAEKSELDVLSGIAAEHWPLIRQVSVEVHDIGDRVQRITELLAEQGFAMSWEQDETLGGTAIFHLYAVRPRSRAAVPPRELPAAVSRSAAALLTAEELRQFLRHRLPEPMVPGRFVFLPELPLTRNGKVDRAALPDPEKAPAERPGAAAPSTPEERLLARIWGEVLGLQEVGVHDNFFELGGDSILAIQVAAKASRAGLRMATRDMFRHQTIADLAVVAAGADPGPLAGTGPVSGPVPLTPIQRWFFERQPSDPQHFNQAILLEVRGRLEARHLAAALAALIAHHDALRLRFVREEGGWRQENAPPGGDVPLHLFDLSVFAAAEQSRAVESLARDLQASLDLERGELVRAALFELGAGRSGRLLLIVHHLAIDGVSWRILLEDLERSLDRLRQGRPVELPPRTTSFQGWSERLTKLTRSGRFYEELPHWLATPPAPVPLLPRDGSRGANTVTSARVVKVALAAGETAAMLQDLPRVARTQIDELLLTALALACREWTGSETLLVDLEGHGREEIADDLDLSRTVGWFTTHFPVFVDLAKAGGVGEALGQVKPQMRRIPNRGIGYGLLRYLSEGGEALAARPEPEIKLNYLGQVDQVLAESPLLGPACEPAGPMRSPRGHRGHLLEVDAIVQDHRLHVAFTYSANLHREETVERLAQSFVAALRSVVDHCLSGPAEGYTPSDFPLAQLGQDELDAALREVDFGERGFS
ncbi:MAG TPA: amino acid adenylation domain-containing protein [Thermoanaerobaculia bacterium]|nr:amino acid adenylation domain-containing protein [Thermoanaerobaculia bacterium]